MKRLFWLSLMFMLPLSDASELVLTCDIGSKTTKRVEILRDAEIGDTHIYYLRQDEKTRPFFDSPDDSRGAEVHIACVGKKRHALVVSGAFKANFLQGFVLTYNPGSGRSERLEFAEKSPPQWLYLGASKTLIVLPTYGYGETNKKYIVYRHFAGAKVDAAAFGRDGLPGVGRFEVIKLEQAAVAEATK